MKDFESIYKQFVEFEERAAAIYLQLASRFSHDPELSSFWLDMAMHEKQHAGLLQFCLCDHLFASDLPAADNIQRLAGFFKDLEQHAADPNITREQAFSLAIRMEASEINTIYCNLTTTLHESMYLLRRKIALSLPGHIDELITVARKFGVGEDVLEELKREKERCSGQWASHK
jgi:hypothetical protein